MTHIVLLVLFFATLSATALKTSTEFSICAEHQWQCREETCIDKSGWCNGTKECPDGSDEIYASCRNNRCPESKFRCAYGGCIDAALFCDDNIDCHDYSDEANPLCRPFNYTERGEFECWRTENIPASRVCDGISDCIGGKDENVNVCATQDCPAYMYQCAYGACIDQGANCDGVKDCADGSDESDDVCKWIPPSQFQLKVPVGNCLLPDFPENGHYIVLDTPDVVPGLPLDAFTLNVSCNPGYGFSENSKISCSKGIWSSYMPTCDKLCKMVFSRIAQYVCLKTVDNKKKITTCGDYVSKGTIVRAECPEHYYYPEATPKYMQCLAGGVWNHVVTCIEGSCKSPNHRSVSYYICTQRYILESYEIQERNKSFTSEYFPDNIRWNLCDENYPDGTLLRPRCRKGYYLSGKDSEPATCTQGSWDKEVRCTPVCGQWNITTTNMELPPWHAGIYRIVSDSYKQICGGSLIKENIVISAAQCFWSKKLRRMGSVSNFAVAVGKVYQGWNNSDDHFVQKSNISNIKIPNEFTGYSGNLTANIALVFTTTTFKFNSYVNSICLDLDIGFNRKHVLQSKTTKIARWDDTTRKGKPAEVLKVMDMPYIKQRTCIANTSPELKKYLTDDKLCGGYINGTVLCSFNAGEGVAFPDYDLATVIYYLRGVASIPPLKEGACIANSTLIFTQLVDYKLFIEENTKTKRY